MRNELPSLAGLEREQRAVIDFLSDPATHDGNVVERVDTHISRIFLAGQFAWKLKRAKQTNYLDFSTLEKREAACRRELEVNGGPSALYLGVEPVVNSESSMSLGGQGQPVDWLVKMQRFDRAGELDRLDDAGVLCLQTMESVADTVAEMHHNAPKTPGFGDAKDVAARIDQIGSALRDAAEDGAFAEEAERWRSIAQAQRVELSDLLDQRARLGFVRRCHGDLHLGNIVMLDGKPTPFDAIEFDEEIASIAVLYDIALTLSDLLIRDRRSLANALLNSYLSAARHHSGLSLLPLYLSMRGAVRSMAAASRDAHAEAAKRLSFAQNALAPLPPPAVVTVGGLSGSGKSTVCRLLGPMLFPLSGGVILRSDVTRKRLAGVNPETSLPQHAYTERMSTLVLRRMLHDARRTLRAGFTVCLDATFLDDQWSEAAHGMAIEECVPFSGIWLETSPETAAKRVRARLQDASDADETVVARQLCAARAPDDWIVVDANHGSEIVLAEARKALLARGHFVVDVSAGA